MNVFATWIIEDSGSYRGVVMEKASPVITCRTADVYLSRNAAEAAAQAIIDSLVRA